MFNDDQNPLKTLASTGIVIVCILYVEVSRRLGTNPPIPFLLLYASVVLSGSLGGKMAGIFAGILASSFVLYAAITGFGPAELTGTKWAALAGMALFTATGLFVGPFLSQRLSASQKEKARIAQLLRESQESRDDLEVMQNRFRKFSKISTDWFWEMDTNRRFTWFSGSSFDDMAEISEWLLGKTRRELNLQGLDAKAWEKHIDTMARHEPFNDFEYCTLGMGASVWVSASGVPNFDENGVFTGYSGVAKDITKRIEMEQSAKSAQLLLAQTIDSLKDGFSIWDKNNRLAMFNDQFQKLNAGFADKVKIGIPRREFLRHVAHQDFSDLSETEQSTWITDQLHKDKDPYNIQEHQIAKGPTLLVTKQQVSDGILVSLEQDISQLKRLEAQVIRSQRLKAVGELTGGIAHDFNNLLAVIQGNTELLDQSKKIDQASIDAILRATVQGANLTGQLLAFSSKMVLQPGDVDAQEMIQNLLNMLSRTIGQTIQITTEVPKDLWSLFADETQLENALMNLILNARDACNGEGTIKISGENVSFATTKHINGAEISAGDYVVVSVIDNGEGMDHERLTHVFEPFFTTKTTGRRSGMGLAMVYGFMRQSHGQVTIQSEPQKGTTVALYLPRAQDQTKLAADLQPAPLKPSTNQGNGEVILVIEDEKNVRMLVEKMLESLGYACICTATTNAAQIAIETTTNIDLVLSDVVLGSGTNGLEFAKIIRKTRPDLKFIFMSGFPINQDSSMAYDPNDKILLAKPFLIADLGKVLHKALQDANSR